ncbi:L-lactate permease [Limnofasciculus baicalensis]|uniref:L-lactate permease n=1 Tax=Limnofasciculus baicalensis BBK-W-15 TaxID=2699891 RepID=A0AAE3GP77_9CYAN|nr:L-lactate permease [Limnofasciculus baicalensis]MCP2727599.1 L-lactate permease [Limnofasciculus baicalensis BBK-W-15]
MNLSLAFTATLPIVTVILCILYLKKNVVFSSFSGLVVTGLLIIFIEKYHLNIYQIAATVKSASILSISAIIVIVPGLYLTRVLREQKSLEGITSWIESLPINPETKALILLVGFLPAIESLTGFGVSLFLGIPIFFKLFPEKKALKLSILGMNIMPWGTLGLATIIGAKLIDKSPAELGTVTSLTSFLVFPYLTMVSLYAIGGTKSLKKYLLLALVLGITLSSLIWLNNRYLYTETAGVFAGIITGIVGMYIGCGNRSYIGLPLKALKPYILVLLLIVSIRFIQPLNLWLAHILVLRSENVSFSPLTSPGIVLLLVALLVQRMESVQISLVEVLKKSQNACLSLITFLLLSQAMLQSGMIKTISAVISSQAGEVPAILLSPLIGMLSGFATGSNLGGNALLITAQYEIGQQWGQGILFAAAHNSGAGHMVFSSIPVIVLAIAIVKDTYHNCLDLSEYYLLKFTLKVSIGIYLAILSAIYILKQFL